ncbi:MAG: hypothetical protein OK474_06880 [Thaumarchaeota archaeon]|nr:hypothetical protein [Nitrososphaerota archaeon]
MATNSPTFCGDSPETTQTTLAFTTNGTEWYSLGGENNLGYSIVITYSGQTYTSTGRLEPGSVTCTTYFIPSGITDVTTGGSICLQLTGAIPARAVLPHRAMTF